MEVGRKFIAQYTRSFFLSKGALKGGRILVILYEFIALLLDYIMNWDRGSAFPRDFTGLVILVYFIIILLASYKLTVSTTLELSAVDIRLTQAADILFTIAFTSALFDTIVFWSLIYPDVLTHHITFYIVHFYIFNFLIMLLECLWSLMVIRASRFAYIIISSAFYTGLYFLWKYLNKVWMIHLPHGGLPIEMVIVLGIVSIYWASFWIVFGVVALRDRLQTQGLFTKEEKFHIIDSQSFQ